MVEARYNMRSFFNTNLSRRMNRCRGFGAAKYDARWVVNDMTG